MEKVAVEKASWPKVVWEFTWVDRVTAFLESIVKRAIEKTEVSRLLLVIVVP